MKIVNKQEFLKLPEGTIYAQYQPCVFDGLFVKGVTHGVSDPWTSKSYYDYDESDIIHCVDANGSNELFDLLNKAEKDGSSFDLHFDTWSRNGMYNEYQLYAIYEEKDIRGLIEVLQESLKKYK